MSCAQESRTVSTGWQKLSAISIFLLKPLHIPTSRHNMKACSAGKFLVFALLVSNCDPGSELKSALMPSSG